MPGPRRTRRPLVALIVLLVILAIGYTVQALHDDGAKPATTRPSTSSAEVAPGVALSALPSQARTTVRLIQSHGPFPYSQDGTVFGNAERHLPIRKSGYYHEYTVPTPGESDRGPRRIITGGSGEYYYTADHYDSFVRVDVGR